MSDLNIPVILGTARRGRESEKVAKYMVKRAKQFGFKSALLDVKDYRTAATDASKKSPQAKKLAKKIAESDGLIIVTPEYNHAYPGELKMMLDLLYEEYEKRAVGVCGVSDGRFGGIRAIEALKPVLNALGTIPINNSLAFPKVSILFDKKIIF